MLESGVDFVTIGRAAILHHNFPLRIMNDPDFISIETPVSSKYLRNEGLGEDFIKYMHRWDGFVKG